MFHEARDVCCRGVSSVGCKVETVRLVREREVSIAEASRDLDVHENVLRKWVMEFSSDPKQAFRVMGS